MFKNYKYRNIVTPIHLLKMNNVYDWNIFFIRTYFIIDGFFDVFCFRSHFPFCFVASECLHGFFGKRFKFWFLKKKKMSTHIFYRFDVSYPNRFIQATLKTPSRCVSTARTCCGVCVRTIQYRYLPILY